MQLKINTSLLAYLNQTKSFGFRFPYFPHEKPDKDDISVLLPQGKDSGPLCPTTPVLRWMKSVLSNALLDSHHLNCFTSPRGLRACKLHCFQKKLEQKCPDAIRRTPQGSPK